MNSGVAKSHTPWSTRGCSTSRLVAYAAVLRNASCRMPHGKSFPTQ
jgi:hypothetical protein